MDKLYFSGRVKRCHILPTITQDNCAGHSWGVAKHLHFLNPNCRKELILAGIFHDSGEIKTGDFPWTMKTEYPLIAEIDVAETRKFILDNIPLGSELLNLTQEEDLLLSLADMLDFYDYCDYEVSLGNTLMQVKKQRSREVLIYLLQKFEDIDSPLYESVLKYVTEQLGSNPTSFATD